MSSDRDGTPPEATWRKPVLSTPEIIGLVVILVTAVVLAVPAMKHTYTGAVLSGECVDEPLSPVCNPRGPSAGIGISTPSLPSAGR